MKSIVLTLGMFFAFTAFAAAQEEQDKTQRQPPTITQAQVEKDAKMAEAERKKHENEKNAVKEEKQRKEDKWASSDATSKSSTKKTSTQPGKQ